MHLDEIKIKLELFNRACKNIESFKRDCESGRMHAGEYNRILGDLEEFRKKLLEGIEGIRLSRADSLSIGVYTSLLFAWDVSKFCLPGAHTTIRTGLVSLAM